MTVVNGTRAETAEQCAAQSGANPSKTPEFDQVVVLVRLPYLPQRQVSTRASIQRAVCDPGPAVSTSTQRTDTDSQQQSNGCRTPKSNGCRTPRSPSVVSKLRAYVVRAFSEFEKTPYKKRISPTAWKVAGLAVTIVLIFAALALLNGAFDRDTELVSPTSIEPSPAERPGRGFGALDTTPRLTLAPKPNEIIQKEKQSATLGYEESNTKRSKEETSTDGSEKELAVADAPVEVKESLDKPAKQKSADSTPEDQVAELDAPELEPMTSNEEPVGAEDSLAVSSTDNPPTSSGDAPADQPSTSATPLPEDVESEREGPPPTAFVDETPPSAEMQMTSQQTQNVPDTTAEPACDLSKYPRTDPSMYRYPTRYENLLSNAAKGITDESYPIARPGTSIYGWHPSTVRLQPRIEPPPIR